jgi:hypothetical protein
MKSESRMVAPLPTLRRQRDYDTRSCGMHKRSKRSAAPSFYKDRMFVTFKSVPRESNGFANGGGEPLDR